VFWVWDYELGFSGSGFRASGFGFRVLGFGFRCLGFGFRVPSSGFRVSGFGFGYLDFEAALALVGVRAEPEQRHLPSGPAFSQLQVVISMTSLEFP